MNRRDWIKRSVGAGACALLLQGCGERRPNDVVIDRRQLAPLADHSIRFGGNDFRADWTTNKLTDRLEHPVRIALGFGQQRRVRGHPIDDPKRHERLDFSRVRCIDE